MNGDSHFFMANTNQKKRIYEFEFMNGNCFHYALIQCQKDICLVLVNYYGFDPTKFCKLNRSPIHWLFSVSTSLLDKNVIYVVFFFSKIINFVLFY